VRLLHLCRHLLVRYGQVAQLLANGWQLLLEGVEVSVKGCHVRT
jgi:hypothetical protein